MPPTKHPRNVTHEQFANSCTIDGSRLDKALGDIERRWNKIEGKDIRTRWMQTQFIQGWSPMDSADIATQLHHWPWMNAINETSEQVSGDADDITNRYRSKGYDPREDFTYSSTNQKHWHLWQTAFYFHDPAVLSHLATYFITDENGHANPVYDNDLQTAANDPDSYVSLAILVDSEFDKADRSMSELVWNWNSREIEFYKLSQINWQGAYTDMTPSHPGGDLNGAAVEADLILPIPQRSRVRVIMAIPVRSAATDYQMEVQHNLTLTALEPIRA